MHWKPPLRNITLPLVMNSLAHQSIRVIVDQHAGVRDELL
jgi:hypothetical protein